MDALRRDCTTTGRRPGPRRRTKTAYLLVLAVAIALAVQACAGDRSPTTSSARQESSSALSSVGSLEATSAPAVEGAPRLTGESTPAPGPQAAARPGAGETGAAPSSPDEELRRSVIDPKGWRTNFAKRTVKLNDFVGGSVLKDGIPAINKPKFVTVREAGRWLKDREAVEVVEINGDVRAYPQQILVWHEIVNDIVGGEPVVITY